MDLNQPLRQCRCARRSLHLWQESRWPRILPSTDLRIWWKERHTWLETCGSNGERKYADRTNI